MKKLFLVLLAIGVGLLFSGCRTGAVYNVEKAPISSKQISLKDTEKAILKAGGGLGWSMKKVEAGYIKATLHLRSHMAAVSIKYNEDEYSLQYLDSANLKYNPAENTIHKNYNGWIQNLDNAIRIQLDLL